MKIKDIGTLNLNETVFKLSNNSITARVNNKTRAVINDIQSVSSLPFNRKVELNIRFKSALNKYFDCLYIGLDNTLYYIVDNKYHELAVNCSLFGNNEELLQLMEKVKMLTDLSVNVLYLNVSY